MKATKLPSGSYRCRVYIDGKCYSVTRKTKKQAEIDAIKLQANTSYTMENMTLDKAILSYIESKTSVLAPSTIREYNRSYRLDFDEIKDIPINNLTQPIIQRFMNTHAANKSPKTCRNIHGLLAAVLRMYRPDFVLNTRLPQKKVNDIYIPSTEEVNFIMHNCEDEDLLNAIRLAVFIPSRRSEIAALTSKDLQGNVVHIHSAMVLNTSQEWVIKGTKTNAGDRFVELPQFVADNLTKEGYLVPISPNIITQRFETLLAKLNINPFHFHCLRHYGCSILHYWGFPDAEIMRRGGWKSDYVMKQVYRHALINETKELSKKINDKFEQTFL